MSRNLEIVGRLNRTFCKITQAESRKAMAAMLRNWRKAVRKAEPVDDIGESDE